MDGPGDLSPEIVADLARYAPDPIVAVTLDGAVLWANEAADEVFSTPERGLAGNHVLDFIHADDHEQALLAMGAVTVIAPEWPDRQVLAPAPYRLRHADGSYHWYQIAGRIHPAAGDPPVMVAIMRDITRQQRLSRAVELIAGGAAFDEIMVELLHGVEYDRPRRTGGISWIESGVRRSVSLAFPEAMVNTDAPDDPWNRAIATGTNVSAVAGDLRPELQAVAVETGLVNCVAVPVPDPAGNPPACFVLWADHEAVVDSLQYRAHRQVQSLIQLALNQRHERHQLRHAATHDSLTGLLNRKAMLDALHHFEDDGRVVSLLFLDLDDFKPVNDTHGHEAGDLVLAIIAGRLSAAVRAGDLVARVGGDEFAVAAIGLDDPGELLVIAERLVSAVGQTIAIDRGGVPLTTKVGVSIGIAVPDPPGPRSPDALLAAGDSAMYATKRMAERHVHIVRV